MSTKRLVVHCKADQFDVYIGRPSVWGNPFSHKAGTLAKFRVASVAEAISSYREWLLSQPELIERARRELKGKVLGCWCKTRKNPDAPCHGDVLAEFANASSLTHLMGCSFKVGERGVVSPIEELWKQATPAVEALASAVHASRVSCNQCGDVMGRDELFGRDLKTIACPNCYSSDLSVIEVRFELG